jgi:hypothetical protein
MPANNVNCEALRSVVREAKQLLELKKMLDMLDADELSELETSVWMMEKHVKEHDDACTN